MIVPWIDIATAAYEAGFRGEDMSVAIAMAQPESERHSDAHNPEDPNGGSFGLLQINGVHDSNATGTYPNKVPTQAWIDKMYNPKENYKAAYKIYLDAGKAFTPWGTFTSGAYLLKWHTPVDVAKVAMDGRARIMSVQNQLISSRTALGLANLKSADLQKQLDELQAAYDTLLGELTAAQEAVVVQEAKTNALLDKIENAKNALA